VGPVLIVVGLVLAQRKRPVSWVFRSRGPSCCCPAVCHGVLL